MAATPVQRPASATPEATPAARPLAGRHALVTGASRGIGAAIARELARLGADLTLVARNAEALKPVADELRTQTSVADLSGDMTDEGAATRTIARAADALGTIAILVNNVGGAKSAPFIKTDAALWRRMIELNLTSVYLASRAVAPAMIAARFGRIVNIASTAGLKGYPYVSAYVAAKHGVVGLTRALALEFAKTGITVNAVCPGYTDTPMLDAAISTIAAKTGRGADEARASLAAANPMGRLVTPDEVAAAVGWLCQPEAAAITGHALAVAGGEV